MVRSRGGVPHRSSWLLCATKTRPASPDSCAVGLAIAVVPFQEFERIPIPSQSYPADSNQPDLPCHSPDSEADSEPLSADRLENDRREAEIGAGMGGGVVRKTR